MKFFQLNLFFLFVILLNSCADYKIQKTKTGDEKKFYQSKGFALIYDENLYINKIVNKKINNEKLIVMHSFLKKNTPVRIINPENLKMIETKIYNNAEYPKIFNTLISKKISTTLDLDIDNPYIEIIEIKKNKTFIAKESNIFEEEKNVAEKAPVDDIQMDILSEEKNDIKKTKTKKVSVFILVISDFYYPDSANNLMKELVKKTKINNFSVKKINNKKYRLLAGPFKNFNALKSTYISLNKLGFDNLEVYKE